MIKLIGFISIVFTISFSSDTLASNDTLLTSPELDLKLTLAPTFHPLLSKQNYETVLTLNDLSYSVVAEYDYQRSPTPTILQKIAKIRERVQIQKKNLSKLGWSPLIPIYGKTGRDNSEDDLTAIVTVHSKQRLIIVAFHGSRNGSKFPVNHDGKGDWGANYDSKPVVPSSVGLREIPDRIQIHRGLGNNMASARERLLKTVDQQLLRLGKNRSVWIWTTGHSKGGAMAFLSATILRTHFNSNLKRFRNVKVASLGFSSPRVFYGMSGKKWVYDLMNQKNLFRINVHGDPAVLAPTPVVKGYRSVGVLFLDFLSQVNLRAKQYYGTTDRGWSKVEEWGNVHYTSNVREEGFSFDPNIVMTYQGLSVGFDQGRAHLKRKYIKEK